MNYFKILAINFQEVQIDPNNDENQEQSSLFNTMMDGFEIVDKKYIKLDEFPVKKMEIKTCC